MGNRLNSPPRRTDTGDAPQLTPDDIMSLDTVLARILDQGLTGLILVEARLGVVAPVGIERARDAFGAYATAGVAQEAYGDAGTPEHTELVWALRWLADNFQGLWH